MAELWREPNPGGPCSRCTEPAAIALRAPGLEPLGLCIDHETARLHDPELRAQINAEAAQQPPERPRAQKPRPQAPAPLKPSEAQREAEYAEAAEHEHNSEYSRQKEHYAQELEAICRMNQPTRGI